ncbi:MAG: hypothetical protein KIT43_09780 [Bauldia sp.]|nr:hypothetical protein [Bauldia sp.]MCW5718489.1 hypothetical protein [Bauldia sp.]
MKKLLAILLSTTCALSVAPALSQEPPPPVPFETVGVKEAIDPGPNLFLLQQSWDGASTLQVFDAVDLTYKGGMGTGMMAQSVVSADGLTAYTMSTYLSRLTYGDTLMVLQAFDIATLTPTLEVVLPPKIAMVGPYEHLLQLSADERFALVMNATPAASVTIVDLVAGEVTAEIPTPGCWEIYPATTGLKWTMLCGDGTARTFVMNDAGTEVVSQEATPVFDADTDPLFVHAERGAGDELIFVSYGGSVYSISDAGTAPELLSTFSFADDLELPYAPGGYQLTAYNEANDVLFVTVHADPYDGSHKDGSTEIWVVDLANEALLYRLQPEEHGFISLEVTDGDRPVLYGFTEHSYTVHVFDIDLTAPFGIIMTETGVVDVPGGQVLAVRE